MKPNKRKFRILLNHLRMLRMAADESLQTGRVQPPRVSEGVPALSGRQRKCGKSWTILDSRTIPFVWRTNNAESNY